MKKLTFKFYMWVVFWILFLSAIGFVGKLTLFPAQVAHTGMRAAEGVVSKTVNADNILTNYENFINLYNGAKQQVVNIKNAEVSLQEIKDMYGDPSTWSSTTKEEYNFRKQTLEGYKQQYSRIVSEYNADSRKLNRNLFKDRGLPYELPLDPGQLNGGAQ